MTEETAADSVVANVLPALVVLFIVGDVIVNGNWFGHLEWRLG
jgi:hypothetical protein